MYNYPVKRVPYKQKSISTSNRGMKFEEYINESNEQYLKRDIAVIHKKPTPVQIVEVDYPKRSMAKINEAYYKTPSTTDYNGVYRGYYIDFDAKQCNSTTSFPISNIHPHQIRHLNDIKRHGGIGFLLIYLTRFNEIYLLECDKMNYFVERSKSGGRKSIEINELRQSGYLIKESFPIRIPYLEQVDKIIDSLK
ncbi:Holliday junction resolvase RecU [bacterium]|nr:Holliday junction resolvase RecU [bacterium]